MPRRLELGAASTEARAHWRALHRDLSIAGAGDAELLGAVCTPGIPPVVNRYVSRLQERAFSAGLARCSPGPGSRVFEIGCGSGRWTRRLTDTGAAVTAVELSEEAIARARLRAPEATIVCGDFLELAFEAGSFDLVVSVTVIQHLLPDEQRLAFARIARLLRPGGRALLLENVADNGRYVWARSPAGWRKLAEECGLAPLSSAGFAYDLGLRAPGLLSGRLPRRVRAEPAGDGPAGEASSRVPSVLWRLLTYLSAATERPASLLLPDAWATHCVLVLESPPST